MAIPHAHSGDVIQLPLGGNLGHARTETLVMTDQLELIRLVVPAGKEIPPHQVRGEITVQCLEGRAAMTTNGQTVELTPGQLIYFSGRETHAVRGIEDSSLLVTILLSKKE